MFNKKLQEKIKALEGQVKSQKITIGNLKAQLEEANEGRPTQTHVTVHVSEKTAAQFGITVDRETEGVI